MPKTTGAAAVAEKPTDALWLAALPTPNIAVAAARLPAPVVPEPAEGVVSGLPAAATDLALSADGRHLVAAHYGADAVSIVATDDLTVRATVDGVAEPGALAVSDRVYVTSAANAEDAVVAIDIDLGTVLGFREINSHVRGLASTPASDTLFVARCGDTADIAAIDVESGTLRAIPVSDAAGATIDAVRMNADGTRLFASLITDAGDAVVVIDVRAGRVVQTIGVPGSIADIAVHRDGRRVVVAGWDPNLGGVLSVIDAVACRVIDTVATGTPGVQVALTADHAYVLAGDEVIVVSTATPRVVETIDTGRAAACLAVNPAGTRLYIADYDGVVEARTISGDSQLRAAS
ncbi:MAG: YncE family protein [Mycobacterium sp.]|nr:YncE family protein [Mycobacterium sp.]